MELMTSDEIKSLIETGALDDALAGAIARINSKPAPASAKLAPWPPPPPWPTVTKDNLAESEAKLAELDTERAALNRRYRGNPLQMLTLPEEDRLCELIKLCDLLRREIAPIKRMAAA